MSRSILNRNNVTVGGAGSQRILFAHGFGCDQQIWRRVAPAFERSHQVIRFDYVGCGGSDPLAYDEARYASLDGYAQDLLEICEALGLRDLTFVGHSVSGMIGALAAIREPERFRHLVLICASPCYLNDPPDYLGGFTRADIDGLLEMMERNYFDWAGYMAPIATGNPDRPELASELRASFCSTDPITAHHFAEATFLADHRAALPQVPVPSLILRCPDDAFVPFAVGDYLHSRLPHSVLRTMRARGHCPHLSDPEELIEQILAYVRQPA
jgi:sigma-B regulation protein RsbQ